ncbi:hypothetical protein ANO11243_005730 [Dothideomycetidae sp. 11243]|nr:hypothetical protein ANO11243_005730 [fungal sp. No.11243]
MTDDCIVHTSNENSTCLSCKFSQIHTPSSRTLGKSFEELRGKVHINKKTAKSIIELTLSSGNVGLHSGISESYNPSSSDGCLHAARARLARLSNDLSNGQGSNTSGGLISRRANTLPNRDLAPCYRRLSTAGLLLSLILRLPSADQIFVREDVYDQAPTRHRKWCIKAGPVLVHVHFPAPVVIVPHY